MRICGLIVNSSTSSSCCAHMRRIFTLSYWRNDRPNVKVSWITPCLIVWFDSFDWPTYWLTIDIIRPHIDDASFYKFLLESVLKILRAFILNCSLFHISCHHTLCIFCIFLSPISLFSQIPNLGFVIRIKNSRKKMVIIAFKIDHFFLNLSIFTFDLGCIFLDTIRFDKRPRS